MLVPLTSGLLCQASPDRPLEIVLTTVVPATEKAHVLVTNDTSEMVVQATEALGGFSVS